MRYIELNPVRANMVNDPAQYRWSSYRHIIPEKTPPDKGGFSVRLGCDSHTHCTHPVHFFDNSLIQIMVGIRVVAVWMMSTANLFQFS